MHFDREYFRPEIREGFYVDGTMKRMWASTLQVTVDVFAEVCRKHEIHWFIDSGTLLGAVRHKGYIPWDDDIDVVMLRDDYIRFQAVMNDEFPDGYECVTYHNANINNWDILTRVINFKGVCLNEDFLKNNCDCPFPTGLDIFPLDYIPDDPDEEEIYRDLCNLVGTAICLKDGLNDPSNEAAVLVKKGIEEKIGYHYNDRESIELQSFRLAEAIFGVYGRDDKCSRVGHVWGWVQGLYGTFRREWFEKTIYLPFEGVMLPACTDPDGDLRAVYGDDYMIPDRDFPTHGYPFYNGMMNRMIGAIGYDPVYYHIDADGMAELKRQMQHEKASSVNKRVLFVVPKASYWKYMEWYYEKLTAEEAQVQVMPIPFADCDFYRNPVDEIYEYDKFPEELSKPDYHNTYIQADEYDEIVFSFPYDRYNATELIDMNYFSSELRKKTRCLTYISPFETDDRYALTDRDQEMMRSYVTVPGIVYADTVYVQSDRMKRAYMKRIMSSYDEEIVKNPSLRFQISRKDMKKIFWKKIRIKG